ncbi:MAG: DUF4062 domain-containing protein, partial [Planctomycetaceae bacterium]|nr:DUF4062 domain-containing protein [Planctomycetaceae bacterium]
MKVFVSATSSDLRDARKLANRVLLTHDIQPVDQEHFAADERSLSDYLEASVGRSDAVVCLVGNVFGAAPGDEPDRSYTQLEYDFARLHNKPVFVFMTSESFSAPGINQTDESRLRQLEHRTRLLDQHKCEIFDDLHQLELALLHALPRLRSQCGDRPFLYRKPPVPPDVFIGRAEECGQLKNALNRNHPSAIAVVGIAGQGKTTLVQQVLRERLEQTHESGFWCTAHETEFTFDAFLDEVLQYLTDGQFDKLKMKEMRTRTTELLKHLQQKPSIIVLDSFEQWLKKPVQSTEREALKESRRATFQELDEFVSGASGLNSGSHLLLITRVVPAALDHVELSTIPVRNVAERNIGMEGLTPAASVELMRNLGVQGTEDELLQLAKTFAFHPLAIRVVAGYVFEEYGGLLTEMESLSDADPDKALECLVEQVQLNLPARQESVRLLQCVSCSLESPSVQTISEILSSDTEIGRKAGQSLRRLIAALSAYQLVQFDSCSQTIVVHPLIKKYFHDSLTSADKAEIHLRYSLHYESTELIEAPLTLNDMRPKRLALEHAILSRDPEICYRILFSQVMHSTPLVEWFSLHGHHSEGISLLTRIAEIESVNLKYRFQIPVSVYCLQLGRTKEAVAVLDQAIHYLEIVAEGNQEFTLELAVALMNRG